jgi:hypothetical protein
LLDLTFLNAVFSDAGAVMLCRFTNLRYS